MSELDKSEVNDLLFNRIVITDEDILNYIKNGSTHYYEIVREMKENVINSFHRKLEEDSVNSILLDFDTFLKKK
jgi:hypothetical protein